MRLPHLALALAALLAAAPAAAQVSNHGIAVESGLSTPLGGGGGPAGTVAVTATTWLEGDVEGVARVAYTSAAETGGRAAAATTSGTLGLRLSAGHAPLRLQAFVDAGWARVEARGVAANRATFGVGLGLEWFAGRDLSLAPRLALRGAGGDPSLELTLALGGYF